MKSKSVVKKLGRSALSILLSALRPSLPSLQNMADRPCVFIMSYWNKPMIPYGYHTIAIYYDGNNYIGYNWKTTSNKPSDPMISLSDFMDDDWRFIYGFYIPIE